MSDDSFSEYGYSLSRCMRMLLLDVFLYGFLAWYLNQVIRTQYGTSRRWYFCLQPLLRRIRPRPSSQLNLLTTTRARVPTSTAPRDGLSLHDVEAVPAERAAQSPAVRLEGLVKRFPGTDGGAEKVAVDGLSLDMYEGEIVCLLGHNGAGKSTTINLMTGMSEVTEGDAYLYGHSITTDTAAAQRQLGVCPQHDVLYDNLTVDEHLRLFASLKSPPPGAGSWEARVSAQIKELVDGVGLEEKQHARAATLSGGQKRKLSLACALMGNPKVLFLDEPTTGLDPDARRKVWSLLERKKEGRVTVLTTHFMDEADMLGDRIAILVDGKLRVMGSSLFLKTRFGIGYTLTLDMSPQAPSTVPSHLLDVLRQHVPGARLLQHKGNATSTITTTTTTSSSRTDDGGGDGDGGGGGAGGGGGGSEQVLRVRLPLESSSQFGTMLGSLDEQMQRLHVQSYGISVTSLEEVFMQLASGHYDGDSDPTAAGPLEGGEANQAHTDGGAGAGAGAGADDDSEQGEDEILVRPDDLRPTLSGQVVALVQKRFLHSKRDKRFMVSTLFMPVLYMVIGTVIASTITIPSDSAEPYPLSTALFDNGRDRYALLLNNDDQTLEYASPLSGPWEGMDVTVLPHTSSVQGSEQAMLDHGMAVGAVRFDSTAAAGPNATAGTAEAEAVSYSMYINTSTTASIPVLASIMDSATMLQCSEARSTACVNSSRPLFHETYLPLPKTASDDDQSQQITTQVQGLQIAIWFQLGFAYVPPLITNYVVLERSNNVRHMQTIMGVTSLAYHLSNLVFDMAAFMPPFLVCIIMLSAGGTEAVSSAEAIGAVALLLVVFQLAAAPWAYNFSRWGFKKPATAMGVAMALNIMLPLMFVIAVFVMNLLHLISGDAVYSTVATLLSWVGGLLLPTVNLGIGLLNVAFYNSPAVEGPGLYDWQQGVGRSCAILALEAGVFWCILLLREWQSTRVRGTGYTGGLSLPWKGQEEQGRGRVLEGEDDDVAAERARVDAGAADEDNILIHHLAKTYRPRGKKQPPKQAVLDLCLGVPRGQCFGLLGVNGAGKTTTLAMLCGDVPPSSGTASLSGRDIRTQMAGVHGQLGYCPQFDALLDNLTGREMLMTYARIKGVPEDLQGPVVDSLIRRTGLSDHASKTIKGYSGGNKRKLSLGIALVGSPSILFVDEASSGMDPFARRQIWAVIRGALRHASAILTSHFMDEADALCQRIGVMVNGRLTCLGSAQHLKSKYGSGYEVEISTGSTDADAGQASRDAVLGVLRGVAGESEGELEVLEQHQGRLKCRLPAARSVRPAAVFAALEECRAQHGVESYSISQTSLEQVFLSFARGQQEVEADAGLDPGRP